MEHDKLGQRNTFAIFWPVPLLVLLVAAGERHFSAKEGTAKGCPCSNCNWQGAAKFKLWSALRWPGQGLASSPPPTLQIGRESHLRATDSKCRCTRAGPRSGCTSREQNKIGSGRNNSASLRVTESHQLCSGQDQHISQRASRLPIAQLASFSFNHENKNKKESR